MYRDLESSFPRLFPLQLLWCFLRTCKCHGELLRFFDNIFKPAHINNLQTENTQNSSSTSKHKRLTILRTRQFLTQVMQVHFSWHPGGVLPYLGYTGTCRWIGYGFLASLSKTGYTI